MSNPLKLVPTDPTYFMIGAGARAVLAAWEQNKNLNSLETVKIAYAAMLEAAPAIDAAPEKSQAVALSEQERASFLTYWCDDVPENLREKWKESVDQALREGNATSQLVSAWDAWQARADLAAPAIDAAPDNSQAVALSARVSAEAKPWRAENVGAIHDELMRAATPAQSIADTAGVKPCEVCDGVGKIGTPGQRCFGCEGSGQSKFASPAIDAAPDNSQAVAFEQWASDPIRADKIPLDKHPNGAYSDTRAYLIHYGWKSALKYAAPAIEGPAQAVALSEPAQTACPECGGGPVTWKCLCEPMWRPATPSAENRPAQDDVRDARRYRYLRDAVGVILDCSHTGPWKFGDAVDTQCDEWLARKAAIASQSAKEPR